MTASVSRALRAGVALAITLGMLACSTPDKRSEQERALDRALARRVEAALVADPYVDADHVTVNADHGVVRLTGLVGDAWALRGVLRISSAVPGVQRVDDELEITDFGRTRR